MTQALPCGFQVSRFAKQFDIPVVADGGIRSPGHIMKALTLGASCVMMGSMLAGTHEAPGQWFYREGIRMKKYRGMGSKEAMEKGSSTRYLMNEKSTIRVEQGVSAVIKSSSHFLTLAVPAATSPHHLTPAPGAPSFQPCDKLKLTRERFPGVWGGCGQGHAAPLPPPSAHVPQAGLAGCWYQVAHGE